MQTAPALRPQVLDARRPAPGLSWSCVVAVDSAGRGLVCGVDLEDYVGRSVWDAVECTLGDPDVLTVDCRGNRVIVRVLFPHKVGQQVDLVSAIREPVIAAVKRVGWLPSVVLGLAAG
jgi:hypothetical protein